MSKFNNLKDEVIYGKSLDSSYLTDQVGSVDELGWYGRIDDLYGYDWIVFECQQGFVTVERFEHIDIDDRGYFCPTDDAWKSITDEYDAFYGEDEVDG